MVVRNIQISRFTWVLMIILGIALLTRFLHAAPPRNTQAAEPADAAVYPVPTVPAERP